MDICSNDNKPSLTIIILNYNTADLTLALVDALWEGVQARGWQLLVVDNASADNSYALIATAFPQLTLIASPLNRGFAHGNNLGLAQARGEVIALLNSDVLISVEQLEQLRTYLQRNPTIGALSPGLLTRTGQAQAFAFGQDPTLGYLLRRALQATLWKRSLHNWQTAHPLDVEWVSAACFFVKREVIEQVGGLDDRFFLYFEDNDWCRRIRQAGWRVVYTPDVWITHLGGSSQPERALANQHYYASLYAFHRKHYSRFSAELLRIAWRLYQQVRRV